SSRRRHTRSLRDWSSDVCSSDLEPLFEISTDKVDTEIPAPSAGVLAEVAVEEGKTVAIGTVVGKIDEAGSGATAAAPAPAKPERSEERRVGKEGRSGGA